MTINNNSLARYRKRGNVSLEDLAYILNVDTSNLAKVEKGFRKPNPRTILAYHILFGVGINELFHDQYRSLKDDIISQSKKLISRLETKSTPKSKARLSFFQELVNSLSNDLL